MKFQPLKAALLVTCAAMASPALAQATAPREQHVKLDKVEVYGKEDGKKRGYIDAKAYDEILASPSASEAMKRNLRNGVQWAIRTVDGGLAMVSPGFECIRDPRFSEYSQCDVGDAAAPASVARSQPPLTRLTAPSDRADAARSGRVAFISSDGSAASGSRSVFILRDVASGETILVPVAGRDKATRAEVYVRPGTYDVTPPAPSVNGYRSFYTSKVSAAQVTVKAGANPAVVDFSLGVQTVPVAMRTSKVASDSVTLDWDALPDVSIQSYTLVRTAGDAEAASESAGTVVARGGATTKSAVAKGLAPNSKYSFTLFSKASDGKDLPKRSVSVSTARKVGVTESAYALAPNTIVAGDFASLRVEPVSETSIRVALPANVRRGSSSDLPGVAAASLKGNGCVVGTPFLVTTEVAGDQSFYGLIDACENPVGGTATAIVNRDVPLVTVFNYFKLKTANEGECYDGLTGKLLPGGSKACDAETRSSASASAAASRPSGPGAAAPAKGPALPFASATNLVREQRYWSQSGNHYLVFQNDGNLVVYRADGGYVWGLDRQPNADFRRIARVSWQADGNLAAYTADNQWVWSALTQNPDPSARLVINPDGVLQIVAGARVMWSASRPLSMRKSRDERAAADFSRGDSGPAFAPTAMAASFAAPASFAPAAGWASKANYVPAADAPWRQPAGLSASFDGYDRPSSREFGWNTGSFEAAQTAGYAGSALPVAMLAASSKVSCSGSGKARFDLAPKLEPLKTFDLELSYLELKWKIEAGVSASFSPSVEISGSYSCALDLPAIDIKFAGAAVPVSLRLKPDISAEANASLKLEGPSFALDVGIESSGRIFHEKYDCGWFSCSHRIGMENNTKPIAKFTTGPASANLTGTLTFRAGVDANLGFGYDIGLAKARAGVSLVLSPLSAELKAQAGTSTCASASIGYQIDAKLVAEAYIPIILDEEEELPLYESGHKPYPGAAFVIGDCGDDD